MTIDYLAVHEEGTWTFPKDLIPTIREGTVLCAHNSPACGMVQIAGW